ncbi:MAG: hypothetical protein GF364_05855, partial [Candidatus Lokiarchaeota archaeon]|nr:hypothetical protein [Candidatus Lokiarchaeota archaeon]
MGVKHRFSYFLIIELIFGIAFIEFLSIPGLYRQFANNNILDIDSAQSLELGHVNTPGKANYVFIEDNTAYVADLEGGLRIIDVSNPNTCVEIGFNVTSGAAWDVHVQGKIAYVAANDSGLICIDVNDPTDNFILGSLYTSGDAQSVFVKNDIAYVAAWNAGLRCINISDPENPVEEGFFDTDGSANWVYIVGNIAYIADWGDGLVCVNVTDHTNPQKLGSYQFSNDAKKVFVLDNIAYVTAGLRAYLIDVEDPNNLKLINDVFILGSTQGVHVKGDLCCVTAWDWDAYFYDITNLADIEEIGTESIMGFCTDVWIEDQIAYITAWEHGLRIFNISTYFDQIEPGDNNGNGGWNWDKIWKIGMYIAIGIIGLFVISTIIVGLYQNSAKMRPKIQGFTQRVKRGFKDIKSSIKAKISATRLKKERKKRI